MQIWKNFKFFLKHFKSFVWSSFFSREKILYRFVFSGRLADLLKPDSTSEGTFYNVTYVISHNADDVTSRPVPDEQRLMNHILRGYEKAVRPVQNASTAVIVKMGLTLTQIFDMASTYFVISNTCLFALLKDTAVEWPYFF